LRPHSRVTGNFVASPRSPELPRTRSFTTFLNKVGRQARVSVPLLREVYPDHKILNITGNRESQRPR